MSDYLEREGYIVLFHFDPPFKHAKHCYDWCEDVEQRTQDHYDGKTHGPTLVREAVRAGSKLRVVRQWRGTRIGLVKVRLGGNATRHCGECSLGNSVDQSIEGDA